MKLLFLPVLIIGLSMAGCSQESQTIMQTDNQEEWLAVTSATAGSQVRQNNYEGGNFDVIGNGSLMLQKQESAGIFWKTGTFNESGTWSSKWKSVKREVGEVRIASSVKNYGQPQNMDSGWTKFKGNPLISPKGWDMATEQSLQLPDTLEANDQSLVRGTGRFKDKWLLVFNVGGWAVGGWALAEADSLAPLKRGINPFELVEPYPIYSGAGGEHAPNDWVEINGTWYAPDESRDHKSRMWTTPDFKSWNNTGEISGMKGHDPGMAWDGQYYYLFSEDGEQLQFASADDPLGEWTAHGVALEVGDHTGDADLCYFNNAWHMFFDDAPHLNYTIGHAWTYPEDFPEGWNLNNDVFGPENPDQGQQWDQPGKEGNNFGTGDADIAVEDQTLYMTYERTVGIAFKELELDDLTGQQARVRVVIDRQDSGSNVEKTEWKSLTGNPTFTFNAPLQSDKRFRIEIELKTDNLRESPFVEHLKITTGQ